MPIPFTSIQKQDGNTGVCAPSQTGVLAVIANSQSGVANLPGTYTRQSDILAAFGLGALIEDCSYYIQNAQKPVLALKPTCSTASAFGTINHSGQVGTSTVTFTGTPWDEYDVIVKCLLGGTVGTGPITIEYSLDNGNIWSAPIALGVAELWVLNVPTPATAGSSGVTVNFGAGTLVTGDIVSVSATPSYMTNSDLVAALAALYASKLPWDGLLIDMIATATTIATVDSWLQSLEAVGRGKTVWMNTRHKIKPVPTGESEATFATAMAVITTAVSTIRIDVATDGGYVPSGVTGLLQFRPASLGISTRANPSPVGQDPAYRALGALPGYQLTDVNGNPLWHDERLFPGLDALQLSTLCTDDQDPGVYIGNARILSTPTSDFQFDQHARCANVALEVAYAAIKINYSRGVRTLPPDPVTGEEYVLPDDATAIEETVNPQLAEALNGQVQAVELILALNDDLSSNEGAVINANLDLDALRYVKGFRVVEKFVKSIQVPLTQ
jgi:hypothetical protein